MSYQELIDHLKSTGRQSEAQAIQRRALDQYQKLLDAVVTLRPNEWEVWLERGHLNVRRQQFASAAHDLDQALSFGPSDEGIRFEHACLLLLTGDNAVYRSWCGREQERLRASPDLAEDRYPNWPAATTFALAADSGVDHALMIRLAEEAVAADRGPWSLHVLALAHYRGGEPKLAIEAARQAMQDNTWPGHAVTWLILALAHHQLGNANEAKHWLEKAKRAIPDEVFRDSLHPHEWLEAQVLLREARADDN